VPGDSIEVAAMNEADLDEDDLPTPVRARMTVTRVDGHRVDRIIIEVMPPADEDATRKEAADV
ncbi:MAG: hypothetical protein ACK5IM_05920, partial [Demequina sp.]